MLNIPQQWILSGIFLVWTIISSKLTFVKSNPRPIQKDIFAWKSDRDSLIKFKNYEYDKTFWLVVFENSFSIFVLGLSVTLKEWVTGVIGFYPWLIIFLSSLYIVARFVLRVVPKAIKQSINNMRILYEDTKMKSVKIVVFVPLTDSDNVREAIGKAGGGVIGNYDNCSFSSKGIGRFRPNDKANPHIGKANKIEEVKEERIEFVCKKDKAKSVIAAIKAVHPYEEVALDIYPILQEEEL